MEFRINPENFTHVSGGKGSQGFESFQHYLPALPRATTLNSLPPGKFCMLFCRLLIIFKINFSEKFFQEYHQSVKQFGSRSGPTKCRA